MLKTQLQPAVTPEIQKLVKTIVDEDSQYVMNEMRSSHRDNLVVPVRVFFKDGTYDETFSRNISPLGICLIGKQMIPSNQSVDLEIYRLRGEPDRISAMLRWCKPFGKKYFMSGWKFLPSRCR
jgi:hypothetical protein